MYGYRTTLKYTFGHICPSFSKPPTLYDTICTKLGMSYTVTPHPVDRMFDNYLVNVFKEYMYEVFHPIMYTE